MEKINKTSESTLLWNLKSMIDGENLKFQPLQTSTYKIPEGLSNAVATACRWLFKFKSVKLKFQFLRHTSHVWRTQPHVSRSSSITQCRHRPFHHCRPFSLTVLSQSSQNQLLYHTGSENVLTKFYYNFIYIGWMLNSTIIYVYKVHIFTFIYT